MNDHTIDPLTLDLPDDRCMGLAMLVTFTAAALIVTGAVAMLPLISTWWVLGLAFGIHLIMTTAVGFASFKALDTGTVAARRAARQAGPRAAFAATRPPSAARTAA
jgi:hypothetical protein